MKGGEKNPVWRGEKFCRKNDEKKVLSRVCTNLDEKNIEIRLLQNVQKHDEACETQDS